MDLVVYDDDEKRYVPWAVALAAVLLVALLTAVLTFVLSRQASGDEGSQAVGGVTSPAPATSPSGAAPSAQPSSAPPGTAVGPTPAPACEAALLRADAVLTRAETVEQALADHTEIMDELLAERIDAQEALDRALPVLTDGATARSELERAIEAYGESREECSG